MPTHNKQPRHFVFAGHIGNLEEKLPNDFTPPCKHDLYCSKLKTMPKAHCSEDYMKVCGKVKKHYDKWGEGWNSLGVGV